MATTADKVIIYGNHLSQPSRAVEWFCALNNIPFELKNVKLDKGEHLQPEFRKINPIGKIPAIQHGDVQIFESHAILRYLTRAFSVDSYWYPVKESIINTTKIDAYLDWHHHNTRSAANFVGIKFFTHIRHTEVETKKFKKQLMNALHLLDTYWLQDASKGSFIGGFSNPSIADLSCYSELISLLVISPEVVENFSSQFKNIAIWMKQMEQLPHYQSVHKVLFVVGKKLNATSKM